MTTVKQRQMVAFESLFRSFSQIMLIYTGWQTATNLSLAVIALSESVILIIYGAISTSNYVNLCCIADCR